MMLFYNLYEPAGKIDRRTWVEAARVRGIPTLLDAAADIPPLSTPADNLQLGFDMIAVSGGKALGGPNDTGLLLGSREYIHAAKVNASPNCLNIGRGMKVSKEDMVALWAAVERYSKIDHDAEQREWERRITVIETAVRQITSVTTERLTPPIANHVPHLVIDWDKRKTQIDRDEVIKQLEEGTPSIVLGQVHDTGDSGLLVSVFQLRTGEEQIVAKRLLDVLKQATAT
jgi:L-seryl-tRNA(Ser) seleniumtransferase